MNLKESFRYQNKLQSLINETYTYLSERENVTSTTQEHYRTKANPSATDETKAVDSDRKTKHSVNVIGDFLMDLIKQKERLGNAISSAKATEIIDIDNAVVMNKLRQNVARLFDGMADIKASEKTIQGLDYKFNQEGNQVSYRYDIKEVTTIDFDRNKFKGMAKALLKEADSISNELDKIQIDTFVDFSPPYDINDSFEDILDQFVNMQPKINNVPESTIPWVD